MTIRIQSQARASTTGLLPVYTTTLAWDPSRVPRGNSPANNMRTGNRCASRSQPVGVRIVGRPDAEVSSPVLTPQATLSTVPGKIMPGHMSSAMSTGSPGSMLPRLFSRKFASIQAAPISMKVMTGWPTLAYCPVVRRRLVMMPSEGAKTVVRIRSRRACCRAAAAARICGLSAPSGPRLWRASSSWALACSTPAPAPSSRRLELVAARGRVDASLNELEHAV